MGYKIKIFCNKGHNKEKTMKLYREVFNIMEFNYLQTKPIFPIFY